MEQLRRARVRVLVADDHPVYSYGVIRALHARPEFEVIGECRDGRSALACIRAERPDVAVLDVRMPELDGLGVLNAIKRDRIPTHVVLLSAFTESELVYRAVALGARAYLSKDVERDRICDALAAVARGEARLEGTAQECLVQAIQARALGERPALSPREREVLELMAAGNSLQEIGGVLYLSTATVKTHAHNVYAKLEVSGRAAAIAEAMRRGLLE